MEELFRKYNIRPLQVNLQIENFEKYRTQQSKPKTVCRHQISTEQCKIILSRFETEKIMLKLQNRKRQNEMDRSARSMVIWLPNKPEFEIPPFSHSRK